MRNGFSSRLPTSRQHQLFCSRRASCFLAMAVIGSSAVAVTPFEGGNAICYGSNANSIASLKAPNNDRVTEASDGEVKLARYSTAAAEPSPNADDPLAVIAHVQFPRAKVTTVGQAVRYLLLRTGYSLVDTSRLDASAAHLLTLPLPESDRELGTYRVRAMLAVLIGKAFALQVNPVDRTVAFVPATSALAATEGTTP